MDKLSYIISTLILICINVTSSLHASDNESIRIIKAHQKLSQNTKTLADGNNAFALNLYQQLVSKKTGNLFISPYSIRTALCMALAGARGETAKKIRKVLQISLPNNKLHTSYADFNANIIKPSKHHTLKIANSMWFESDTYIRPKFQKIIRTQYNSECQVLDLKHNLEKSRQTINRWVMQKTNNKIRDLIPFQGFTARTELIMVNAVYFQGNWLYQFDEESTKKNKFHLPNKKVIRWPMMRINTDKMKDYPEFRYHETKAAQWLELPYKSKKTSMVIILPKAKDGLSALEKTLTAKSLDVGLAKLDKKTHKYIPIFLPKWELTYGTINLIKTLESLGLKKATSPAADFSGIPLETTPITRIYHKAFIKVNERGTEAAASTATVWESDGFSKLVFRADHPFMYLIRDNASGAILFIGRVTDPRVSADSQ